MDLVALSIYPSNDELDHAAKVAYKEVENLWTLLGAPPSLTRHASSKLPSACSWLAEKVSDSVVATSSQSEDIEEEDFGSDYESGVGDPVSDGEEESESVQIQQALDYLEKVSIENSREEDEINSLALAAVTLSVGDEMAM